jgi:phenylacetate-CoA ligase
VPAKFYRPDIQTLPREDLRALQEERLRELILRVFDQPVPFFKRKLEAAGLGSDDVKTLEDLRRVPRTTKDELRQSEAEHPPLGDYRGAKLSECIRLSMSTGTTGKPTIITFTRHDLDVEFDAAGRMFTRQGYGPNEIVTHAHPGGLNGGQALLGGALEEFGALNVPVGPPQSKEDAERAVNLWRELKPTRYEMFGPALHTFWEAAVEMGLDPQKDLGMKSPNEIPPHRTFSAGIECFAFLGCSCDEFNGAHIAEDHAILEAVDPMSGEPVPEGTRGHLVITTITKDNFLLRYDMEELIRIDTSECPCGETHLRAWWDGRAKDAVTVGERFVLPMDVELVLREIPEVSTPAVEYQLVRGADISSLRVRVEANEPNDELKNRLAKTLESSIDVPVSLELLPSGALPRPSYKPLRVVDE